MGLEQAHVVGQTEEEAALFRVPDGAAPPCKHDHRQETEAAEEKLEEINPEGTRI